MTLSNRELEKQVKRITQFYRNEIECMKGSDQNENRNSKRGTIATVGIQEFVYFENRFQRNSFGSKIQLDN